MTVREPTLKMRVEILEAQVEDYRWALDRLVELVKERNPSAAAAIVDQLREENLVRQAIRTRAANGGLAMSGIAPLFDLVGHGFGLVHHGRPQVHRDWRLPNRPAA